MPARSWPSRGLGRYTALRPSAKWHREFTATQPKMPLLLPPRPNARDGAHRLGLRPADGGVGKGLQRAGAIEQIFRSRYEPVVALFGDAHRSGAKRQRLILDLFDAARYGFELRGHGLHRLWRKFLQRGFGDEFRSSRAHRGSAKNNEATTRNDVSVGNYCCAGATARAFAAARLV
jgi:hypothetical protein